jgi:hypothetical protein
MSEVANRIINEDKYARVWEMVLQPGASSGLHTHKLPWYFVVISAAKLKLIDSKGDLLVPIEVLGIGSNLSFSPNDDGLTARCTNQPDITIPLTHELINIGNTTYVEILVELKPQL